jgi:hypothetical protein
MECSEASCFFFLEQIELHLLSVSSVTLSGLEKKNLYPLKV